MLHSPTGFAVLQKRLTKLGFRRWDLVKMDDVSSGDNFPFGLFARFIFEAFPTQTSRFLRKYDWFCIEQDDRLILQSLLKLLAHEYSYRASLNAIQISKRQFGALKIQLIHDFLILMLRDANGAATAAARSAESSCAPAAQGASRSGGSSFLAAGSSSTCSKRHAEHRDPHLEKLEKRLADLNEQHRALNRVHREAQELHS